jgi:hypothetical protein
MDIIVKIKIVRTSSMYLNVWLKDTISFFSGGGGHPITISEQILLHMSVRINLPIK